MAEKLIGSLIYGEHTVPKKGRPLKERLKVPLAIGVVLLLIGGAAYKFANYREEGRVKGFLEDIRSGRYDIAYARWDTDGHYSMKDFLADWGKDGYYTRGLNTARVVDSNTSGSAVVVYVELGFNAPLALRVDKENLRLSFSPTNKYTR
jgi:hypothetical protein